MSKIYKIAGTILTIIGFALLFPLDVLVNGGSIVKITLSLAGLVGGIFLILFGIYGVKFLQRALFILFSTAFSMLLQYVFYRDEWGSQLVIFWVGLPCGLLSGVFFLIADHCYFSKQRVSWTKRVTGYFLTLAVLTLAFNKGGDFLYWINH